MAALVLVPVLVCMLVLPVFGQTYPDVVDGSGFSVVGSVEFQHLAYNGSFGGFSTEGYTLTVENITGSFNATDARLGMNVRGGTFSFHNEELCQVQLSADAIIAVACSVEISNVVPGRSWNTTFPADTDIIVTWSGELVPVYVTYWSLIIGIAAAVLLFGGVIMLAWAVREHRWNILDADKTMLGIIAICMFIVGIGLLFYWLMG